MRLLPLTAALSLATLAACGQNDPAAPPETGDENARMQVVHLTPMMEDVDVYLDGDETPIFSGLANASTSGYLGVGAGDRSIEIGAVGDIENRWSLGSNELDSDQDYTLVLYGHEGDPRGELIHDDSTGIPDGQFRLRVVHVASTLETVDLYTVEQQLELQSDDMSLGETWFKLMDRGEYDFTLDINEDGDGDFFFTMPETGARLVTLYLASTLDNNTFVVMTANGSANILPTEDNTTLQVGNLSPDAGPLDFYLNQRQLGAGVLNGEYGPILTTPAGVHTLAITPAGVEPGVETLFSADLELEADSSYTIVGHDYVDELTISALFDSVHDLEEGMVRARVIHAHPGLSDTIDIYVDEDSLLDLWEDGQKLGDDTEYGYGEVIDLEPGLYDIGVDLDDDGSVDMVFDEVDVGIASQTNLSIYTDDSGASYLSAQYIDGSWTTYIAR